MSLTAMTETALAQMRRYAEEMIQRRRDKLEQFVMKQDIHSVYITQGNIEELRHLIAAVASELRAREKGTF